MKVAVTGSSGLVGTALTASLRADGHQVVRLVRRPPRVASDSPARDAAMSEVSSGPRPGPPAESPASDEAIGEGRGPPRAADAGHPPLSGVDAVVHLAGAGVG